MKKTSTVSYDSVCDVYDVLRILSASYSYHTYRVYDFYSGDDDTNKGGGGEGAWFSSAQFFLFRNYHCFLSNVVLCLDVHRQQEFVSLSVFVW